MVERINFEADKDILIRISKPLFYGYMFLAGVALMVQPKIAGTMIGVSVMAAIAFISAGISEAVSEDWSSFMEVISIMALMASLLAASYTGASLSLL